MCTRMIRVCYYTQRSRSRENQQISRRKEEKQNKRENTPVFCYKKMLDANVQDVDKKKTKQTNPNKQREQNETKAGGQTAN